jgi:Fe-S-cluster-containing hydrogenase component 2
MPQVRRSLLPANCIQIDPTGRRGNGAPFIAPEEMPCVVCDGLKCMHECPTGALSPIPLGQIDMGTAYVNEQICVRTRGEECTVCIDTCPIGSMAIELRDGKVKVYPQGCNRLRRLPAALPDRAEEHHRVVARVWERRSAG